MDDMGDIWTVRIGPGEKKSWQRAAKAVGEDLSEFARKAVRQRPQPLPASEVSPWDDLLGSVSSDAPAATNQNVRTALRSEGP